MKYVVACMDFLLKDADKNNSGSVNLLVHFGHVGGIKGI